MFKLEVCINSQTTWAPLDGHFDPVMVCSSYVWTNSNSNGVFIRINAFYTTVSLCGLGWYGLIIWLNSDITNIKI